MEKGRVEIKLTINNRIHETQKVEPPISSIKTNRGVLGIHIYRFS